jgi:hypothetical protein
MLYHVASRLPSLGERIDCLPQVDLQQSQTEQVTEVLKITVWLQTLQEIYTANQTLKV